MLLDQSHLGAQTGGNHRRHQSGRPCADHDEVVAAGHLRVPPIRWMNVVQERLVVFIIRRHHDRFVGIHDLLPPTFSFRYTTGTMANKPSSVNAASTRGDAISDNESS